tara:strand:- start:185865 stop:186434 length:570 start_codon:yes stop_codon:yes gene_type:complete
MGILSDLNEIFFGRSSDARLERMRFWTRFKRRSVDFLSLVAQGSLLTIAVVPLGVALVLAIVIVMQSATVESARIKLQAREALTPVVPVLVREPISAQEMSTFVDYASKAYPVLDYSYENGVLVIVARSTDFFPTFDRFLAHADMYHPDWRVKVEAFCAGRDCGKDAPISANLSIFKIAIEEPKVLDNE